MIKGESVFLRSPEHKDVELLNQWSNDPEIWSMLGGWHFPFSSHSTAQWVNAQGCNDMSNQFFCIDTVDDGLIGTANLLNIDWKNRNAFHGMMIGNKELRGKGYALDALKTIMRYAFMELGLKRLDGDMIAYNQRSIDFYINKGGWKKEGIKSNWYYRNGRHHDKIIVGVEVEDYLNKFPI